VTILLRIEFKKIDESSAIDDVKILNKTDAKILNDVLYATVKNDSIIWCLIVSNRNEKLIKQSDLRIDDVQRDEMLSRSDENSWSTKKFWLIEQSDLRVENFQKMWKTVSNSNENDWSTKEIWLVRWLLTEDDSIRRS
jgi:hypothetical protein